MGAHSVVLELLQIPYEKVLKDRMGQTYTLITSYFRETKKA